MIPLVALPVEPHTMLAILQFIEQSGTTLAPGDVAARAIHDWLERHREEPERPSHPVVRGYQWKCLFLPEGTRLRVWCRSEHGYAEVVGDRLMYNGRSVSPNQFVAACSDTVRNAWVEINVLMPGEKSWKLASVRRREIAAAEKLAKERAAPLGSSSTLPAAASPLLPHISSMPPASPPGSAAEPEDDGFGNPLLSKSARPGRRMLLAGCVSPDETMGGRRSELADRRDPHRTRRCVRRHGPVSAGGAGLRVPARGRNQQANVVRHRAGAGQRPAGHAGVQPLPDPQGRICLARWPAPRAGRVATGIRPGGVRRGIAPRGRRALSRCGTACPALALAVGLTFVSGHAGGAYGWHEGGPIAPFLSRLGLVRRWIHWAMCARVKPCRVEVGPWRPRYTVWYVPFSLYWRTAETPFWISLNRTLFL